MTNTIYNNLLASSYGIDPYWSLEYKLELFQEKLEKWESGDHDSTLQAEIPRLAAVIYGTLAPHNPAIAEMLKSLHTLGENIDKDSDQQVEKLSGLVSQILSYMK